MRLVIKERSDVYGSIYGSPGTPDRAGHPSRMEERNLQDAPLHRPIKHTAMLDECGCGCDECGVGAHHETPFEFEIENEEYPEMVIHPDMIRGLYDQPEMIYITIDEAKQKKKKKKGDRCIRIAKRKYHKWPSAYASGAVVKCRQGKIWKGLKESKDSIEFEVIELTESQAEQLLEKYKPVKQSSLKDWFSQNQGKGWIDCRTGESCGRSKAGRGTDRKYPACRPTKAHCNKAGSRRKKGPARVSWKPKKDK